MKRWELYFYAILAAIPIPVAAVGIPLGVNAVLSAFVGASIVSLNFAILVALGRFFFRWSKKRAGTVFLLVAHVFIAPALLASALYFTSLEPIALLIAALVAATVGPMSLAILGLLFTTRRSTLGLSLVDNDSKESD